MYTLDLHTHSTASPDGGLTLEQYRDMLKKGVLQGVAITDHDTIDFAVEAKRALGGLGEHIIVGEEITTQSGHVIGLYLTQAIPGGLTLTEAIAEIKKQGGLVYVPHPFETLRQGVPLADLEAVASKIDIIEGHNGRAVFQNKGAEARSWALATDKPTAASSDAHGRHGWGRAYNVVERAPSRDTLVSLLRAGRQVHGFVHTRGVLYPKFNRLRNFIRGRSRQ